MEKLIVVREAVMALAAGTGAVVAVCGLYTWRSKLKGSAHFDTARRLMLAVYRVRDGLQAVRAPFMSPGEQEEALRERGMMRDGMSRSELAAEGPRAAYTVRWQRFLEAKSEYDLELLAAEVLWASELRSASEELGRVARSLNTALGGYLEFKGRLAESGIGAAEFNRIRKLVFWQSEDDEFSQDLMGAVGQFEEILRAKMEL